MRWIVGIAALVGIGLLTAWAVWPKPLPVDLGTAARQPLEVTVSDDGTTRIREVYTVSAPVAGRLLRSPLDEGDAVVAGKTIVASIRPGEPTFLDARSRREAETAIEAAQAAVNLADVLLLHAEAQHNFALADLRRAQTLVARNTISDRQFEEKELDVVAAEAAVGSARATAHMRRQELESAKARLILPTAEASNHEACCVDVRAPVDGVVIDVILESEQFIDAGTPLVALGNPSELEVVVELLSRDAVRVRVGDRAFVDGWGGGRLEATVRRVDPAARTETSALGIEEQRVEVRLDLASAGDAVARLGHNFRVIAHVVVWEDEALTVPLSALFREGGEWAAFVVTDGHATLTPLKIGERSNELAQVLSGLDEGAVVILHPSDLVKDGVRVVGREIAEAS